MSDYTNNTIWTLVSSDVLSQQSSDRVPFEDAQNTEIILKINLQRKPLYYMMNTVFPCFILNIVTVLTFFMPIGNAIGLGKFIK